MKQIIFCLILLTAISCKENEKIELVLDENELVIGEKVKDIKITDFITNTPNEKDFKGKYLVIDFWATWCAPCLQSVPHFNKLQNHFEKNSEILFISLTDETPQKVKRILNKISFTSIVVSDQSKETIKNYKINYLPQTVIVDKNNIVRWIGVPEELTIAIIEKVISTADWIPEDKTNTDKLVQALPKKIKSENIPVILNQLNNSLNNIYSFNLTFADKNASRSSNLSMVQGKYIELNSDLINILSKLIRKPVTEIIVSEKFKDKTFNLLYKNSNINKDNINMDVFLEQLKIIKNNILLALDLEEKIESKKTTVYLLKVADKFKLEIGSGDLMSHSGDNDNYLTFSNVNIELLMENISRFHNVILIDETDLEGKYEFLIDKNNFKQAKKDLLTYGLSLEKTIKKIEFYIYE